MKNNFTKKLLVLGISIITLLGFMSFDAKAEWKQDSTGWWYSENNSWATNWRYINNKWYYFYPNGYMAHDTTVNGYHVNSNGEWVQQQSNIINNTIDNNNTTTKFTNDNTNFNTYNSNDYDDIDNEDDSEDYIKKYKSKINNSSSSSITSSTSNDSYYDYSSKGSNETWVSGYYRNGKYVSGHYRTKKDSTTSNNYSHKGNINPHNGKRGYNKK